MQKTHMLTSAASADFEPSKSAVAALARACELLKAGDLADAAKWAAIAASLGEDEIQAQTA
jgi:hypothetical protein